MKMKKTVPAVLLLLAAAGWAPALPGQSLWKKARRKISPIEDIIARNIGDILTIVVKEDHKTKAQDKTDRKQENTLYAKLQAYTITPKTFQTPLPEVNLKGTQTFKGDNKQERDQEVEARIAVMVVDTLPNGNMVVSGKREIVVDDEVRVLRISGIVRPRDVKSDNTIRSDQVADARIAIEASGGGRQTTTRGPVAEIIHTAIWFFWPF